MTKPKNFTPWDFFQLAKELAEHDVEMKIKLAKAIGQANQKAADSGSAG
jgi:hypothetical protein